MEIEVHDKKIRLNGDQVKALTGIQEFLADKHRFFLSIQGPAGTGKSTLIKEAIKGHNSVAVTAPTHKAKKVVSKFTGKRAVTLHSLLGLRPDMSLEQFDKHNMLFAQLSGCRMEHFKLTIIDESSLVNIDLYDIIKSTAKRCNTKVIFLGDPYQLTPVKKRKAGDRREYDTDQMEEEISPVFTDPDITHIHLTKVERQQDSNPLMFVYDAIRSDIFSSADKFEHVSNISGEEGIQFYSQPPEFAEHLLYTFKQNSLKDNPSLAKMLCWQNETVRRWNNYVRMNTFGSYKEPIHTGEVIMAYKNVYNDDETKTLLVQNSAEYLISEVKASVHSGIEGWEIKIEDIDALNPTGAHVFVIKPELNNYIKFVGKEQEYLRKAKEASKEKRAWYWRQYYSFKNQYLLLEDITDNYNNVLVAKDFDYAYALTVHKSQGSSYKYVYVDEHDINYNGYHPERNRLKYVAFSRPTNIAHILNY